MPQKTLNLVKEKKIYELFCVRGFMFYCKPITIVLDFQVKFFGCCSISFGVPKKYYKSLFCAPIGFNIIQNKIKMKKIWHLKLENVATLTLG
jgi:hypothetical protein